MNEKAEGPDSYHSRAKEDGAFVTIFREST